MELNLRLTRRDGHHTSQQAVEAGATEAPAEWMVGSGPPVGTDPVFGPVGATGVGTVKTRFQLLEADRGLADAFAVAQRVRRAIRPVLTVEVTSTCNLYCEGCFYFHDDFTPAEEPGDIAVWRDFFRNQYSTGRRYAVFHGAEPALQQARLSAAAEFFQRGIIYTNGTIRMREDLPFLRCVSIWGSEEKTEKVRGGSVYRKALRNFENDPKARFSIIVSAQNYRDLPAIVADLHAAGVSTTLTYFSPSHSYLAKLRTAAPNDSDFFRFSSQDDNMLMSPSEYRVVNDMVAELSERYPGTLRQGLDFNRWLTGEGSRYTLNEEGLANECAVRPQRSHYLYGTDLKPIKAKCALADNDCSKCRVTPAGTTSILHNTKAYSGTAKALAFWIETAFQAGQFFLRDDDKPVWGEQGPPPMNSWKQHFGVTSA